MFFRFSFGSRLLREEMDVAISMVVAMSSSSLAPPATSVAPRLSTVRRTRYLSMLTRGLQRLYCLVDDDGEAQNNSAKEASFDLKLPRRSLLVGFTCNACGERSQRLINRVAYERGTVFLQCAGCLQYHKFVDNLGLVVEYNFLEGDGIASNGDQA